MASKTRVPNVNLTVVIRNEGPMRYLNEPCTYRTVHVPLSAEQAEMMVLDENEEISQSFLEAERGASAHE